jgi:hypothetical protein
MSQVRALQNVVQSRDRETLQDLVPVSGSASLSDSRSRTGKLRASMLLFRALPGHPIRSILANPGPSKGTEKTDTELTRM